ncbi:MAG: serine protease, partial [Planctomycetota bacterium]
SVWIKTNDSVGGGTIVYSRPDRDNNYHTYVLTAYHVIYEIIESKDKAAGPDIIGAGKILSEITIKVYDEKGEEMVPYQAEIVGAHKSKDLALLKIKSNRPFPAQARLVTRGKMQMINIFSPVYVMGCPLGYDPLPTYGEVTSLKREMNGEKFWMTNAPTIFGNSGGGVFLGETGEFIGVSSMISVYTNFIAIPVPHLSLIISPDSILDWLDEQFYQFLYDENYTKEWCDAMREEAGKSNPSLAGGLNNK